ncbi:MAG: hypothetical protein HDR14_14190 [Lachnospiraceae bacterium]|nr:hypothetical protein [Lachnospiraceae bacterium]
MAKVLEAKEAQSYLKEAPVNVKEVASEETINSKTIDYWISGQWFIEEFILGIHLSQEVYNHKFNL